MKVFIDCGAHKGAATSHFRVNVVDRTEWRIHCFEANSELKREYGNAKLHKVAVWIKDGRTKFYRSDNGPMSPSCSLLKEKKTGHLNKSKMVKTVDFSTWLATTFCEKDTIYVKMDIEGAEYAVLEKMIKEGTIGLVKKLFVEFHGKEIGKTKEECNDMVMALKSIKSLELYGDLIDMCRKWRKDNGRKPADFLT